MEVFLYVLAVFIGLTTLFIIIEHPYYMVGVVIFMTVYRFNIAIPLPLDARGLLILVLFVRLIVFDKNNAIIIINYLFKNKIFWLIVFFSISVLIMPIAESVKFTKPLKDIILNLIMLLLGFLVLIDDKGKKIFIYSIFAVSTVASFDLIFTYISGGGLNIVRILDVLSRQKLEILNHNFSGMLASLGLLFTYLLYSRKEAPKILMAILGILYFTGLLLSTSRSALLAAIIIFIIMNFIEGDLRNNIRKFVMLGVAVVILMITFFFAYNLVLKTQSKTEFVDKVYYRLYDEPLQIVGLSDSKSFDIYSSKKKQGSMKFRAEKWNDDFTKFSNLDMTEIGLGVGSGKYSEIADQRFGYDGHSKGYFGAHNGYLIILVERGVIGLILYLGILLSTSISSFKLIKVYQIKAPVIYLFLFIALYSFAQNSELVGVYAYLLMGGVLGNIYSCNVTDEDSNKELEE